MEAQNCIFCQISAGKVSAQRVFEDEHFLAILDINPANPGHTIVMPKHHYQVMPQIPDEEVSKMMIVVQKVSQAILRAMKAEGTSIFIANGAVAGQRAPHFMLHVIPRVDGDGLDLNIPKKSYSLAEMSDTRQKILSRISQAMGTPPIESPPEKKPESKIPDKPRVQMEAKIAEEPISPLKVKKKIDVAEATRFVNAHKELISVVQFLEKGPATLEDIQKAVVFDITHLEFLESLGYIRKMEGKFEITVVGKKFLGSPLKPPVISPPVRERLQAQEDFDLDKLTELLGK